MRVMILMKADEDCEAGGKPTEAYVAERLEYAEALVKAGVMLADAGLLPNSQGVRVRLTLAGITL